MIGWPRVIHHSYVFVCERKMEKDTSKRHVQTYPHVQTYSHCEGHTCKSKHQEDTQQGDTANSGTVWVERLVVTEYNQCVQLLQR